MTWATAGWPLELLGLLALLGIWQAATVLLQVPPYLVPQPLALVASLGPFKQRLVADAAQTLAEAMAGFVGGNLLGLALAVVFTHSRLLERTFLPWMVILKTLPIVRSRH